MEENNFDENNLYDQMRAQKRKKTILTVIVVIVAIIVLALICSSVMEGIEDFVQIVETDEVKEETVIEEDADADDADADAEEPSDGETVPSVTETQPAAQNQTASSGTVLSAADVYEQNVNATVGITTTVTTNYFGFQTLSAASGSGFIISSDGYVVTCYHVIEDFSSVTVTTYDGDTYDAVVVGYSEDNDVAVLKIDAEGLQCVVLGDSDNLRVGDDVLAIGNPLGELTFSLTSGIVSALDRSVTLSTSVTMNLIQTDCAINSGNSGGPLFNMNGEVVGIVNAKYSSSGFDEASIDNIGFAIPIDDVKSDIVSIVETGTIQKPYLGVSVTDMTLENAAASGLSSGAVVQSVTEGSPAEEAGIQAGDIIYAVGDTEVTSSSDLVEIVGTLTPGEKVDVMVKRDGSDVSIEVTVGMQSQSALAEEESGSDTSDGSTHSHTPGSDHSGSSDDSDDSDDYDDIESWFEDMFDNMFGGSSRSGS